MNSKTEELSLSILNGYWVALLALRRNWWCAVLTSCVRHIVGECELIRQYGGTLTRCYNFRHYPASSAVVQNTIFAPFVFQRMRIAFFNWAYTGAFTQVYRWGRCPCPRTYWTGFSANYVVDYVTVVLVITNSYLIACAAVSCNRTQWSPKQKPTLSCWHPFCVYYFMLIRNENNFVGYLSTKLWRNALKTEGVGNDHNVITTRAWIMFMSLVFKRTLGV